LRNIIPQTKRSQSPQVSNFFVILVNHRRLYSHVSNLDSRQSNQLNQTSLPKEICMKKRTLLLACLFAGSASLLSACGSSDDKNTNIVATAEANSSLTTLVAVVKFASDNNDLVNLLSNPGALTVFAPTNAAFDALAVELTNTPTAKATDLLTAANKPLLRNVLQYHVLGTTVKAADIPFGKAITPSLANTFFKIDGPATPAIADGRGRKASIVTTDVAATNGVVHVIDKVILPADKTIVANAIARPEFVSLVAALQFASDNNDLVNLLSGTGNFTVFAPTNAAFDALAVELTGRAGAKAADILIPANKALVKSILQYHVLTSRVLKAEVPTNTAIVTAGSKTFTVSPAFAITDGRNRTANITGTDVFNTNGVIHLIDKVILPPV
jgi:uncharacterized surface protein with fasciclin (FAS1) repeats